jgi:hypothetical protein
MNIPSFIRTEFKDYSGTAYGWRAYDEYSSNYNNSQKTPAPEDDREFIELIQIEGGSEDLFDYMREHKMGCYIDSVNYEYEEIKDWIS